MRKHGFDGDDAAALKYLLGVAEEDVATMRDAITFYSDRSLNSGDTAASERARCLVEFMYRSGWIEFVDCKAGGHESMLPRDTVEGLLSCRTAWEQAVSDADSACGMVLTDAGLRYLAGGV